MLQRLSHNIFYQMNKKEYCNFIDSFKKNEYKFIFFDQLKIEKYGQVILRHDVDFHPSYALEMAKLESQCNIKSTYFFLVRNNMYNLLSKENTEIIKEIKSLGHRISLHFDSEIYEDINNGFQLEVQIFNKIFDESINIISYHRPPKKILTREIEINNFKTTYDDEFFKEIKYFSDSSGVFKYGNPVNSEEFQQNKTMQILIHPIWWISEGNNRLDKILWHKKKQKNSVETNLKNNLNFYGK